jgi:hypothetical protein
MIFIAISSHYFNYDNYFNMFSLFLFQVRIDLRIADHVWQGKRTEIAQMVEALGDRFRPAMRAGWLKYIQNAYPVVAAASSTGLGTLVVRDDE